MGIKKYFFVAEKVEKNPTNELLSRCFELFSHPINHQFRCFDREIKISLKLGQIPHCVSFGLTSSLLRWKALKRHSRLSRFQ